MNAQHIHANLRGINKTQLVLALLLALGFVTSIITVRNAHAANLTNTLVRFDQITTSTATTGTVCVKPATTSTDVKTWTVTFPTGYTVSGTAANWQTTNISTTNTGWPSGAVAWPNATSATASIGSQTVTWTNSAVQSMNNSTIYCYNWTSTSAVTTASSTSSGNTGTVATQDHLAATIDTGSYGTPTVSADTITVSASVPPNFAFTLTGTSDALPTLDSTAVKTSSSPSTVAISTNAAHGWQVWGADSNTGLHSATRSYTIPTNCSGGVGSNTTLSSGAEHFNTGVSLSGTGTVATVFDHAATSFKGGGLCTANQTLASDTALSSGSTLTLYNSASISGTTPPATDYTDVITLTGAGLF